MANHKEKHKETDVLIFTVTHECMGDGGALHFAADVLEGFQVHMRECSNCRAQVVKSLREFAEQLEADRLAETPNADDCLTVN